MIKKRFLTEAGYMKKTISIVAFIGFLLSCNNAGEPKEEKKDSLDSIAREERENIDSSARERIRKIDSATKSMKDSLDRIDK